MGTSATPGRVVKRGRIAVLLDPGELELAYITGYFPWHKMRR